MIKRSMLCGAFLLNVSAFFLGLNLAAQTTDGSITVETVDKTSALLGGTHLVLTDKETNVSREGTTLKSGTFTFGALPPATYRLTVDHTGFSSITYDTVVVSAGAAPAPGARDRDSHRRHAH